MTAKNIATIVTLFMFRSYLCESRNWEASFVTISHISVCVAVRKPSPSRRKFPGKVTGSRRSDDLDEPAVTLHSPFQGVSFRPGMFYQSSSRLILTALTGFFLLRFGGLISQFGLLATQITLSILSDRWKPGGLATAQSAFGHCFSPPFSRISSIELVEPTDQSLGAPNKPASNYSS